MRHFMHAKALMTSICLTTAVKLHKLNESEMYINQL